VGTQQRQRKKTPISILSDPWCEKKQVKETHIFSLVFQLHPTTNILADQTGQALAVGPFDPGVKKGPRVKEGDHGDGHTDWGVTRSRNLKMWHDLEMMTRCGVFAK